MKRIIILLLTIMPVSALAQNFTVENGKVSWQCIYRTDSTYVVPNMEDIYKAIIYSNDYSDITKIDEGLLVAELKPVMLNVEDYGFKRMRSPLYLLHYKVGPITVRIETREGRYRVTVSNIRLTNVTSNFCSPGTVEDIEEYILSYGEPNEQMSQYVAPMFSEYFYNAFIFHPQVEEEW